ncbi:MAG: hypothetical protein JWM68_3318 [Verrucomicrobiales bacterium]|nr:hypothetical protein [Verrucomicrobiales bacterium]
MWANISSGGKGGGKVHGTSTPRCPLVGERRHWYLRFVAFRSAKRAGFPEGSPDLQHPRIALRHAGTPAAVNTKTRSYFGHAQRIKDVHHHSKMFKALPLASLAALRRNEIAGPSGGEFLRTPPPELRPTNSPAPIQRTAMPTCEAPREAGYVLPSKTTTHHNAPLWFIADASPYPLARKRRTPSVLALACRKLCVLKLTVSPNENHGREIGLLRKLQKSW